MGITLFTFFFFSHRLICYKLYEPVYCAKLYVLLRLQLSQIKLALSFFVDISVLNCDVQALCNLPEKVIKADSRRRDYFIMPAFLIEYLAVFRYHNPKR